MAKSYVTPAATPRKIVVLGGGESGTGAAILAKDLGHDVFLSDFGTIAPQYARMLQAEGIDFEQNGHDMDRILAADTVVKSPGIAKETPVMRAIARKNIPVISEIEFAGLHTGARMVCITGSNGKTTTTLLTYHLLRGAGIDAGLAGNVGRSLALQVARAPHKVYVIELSSFQLDDMYRFRADIAVMLNITPDHLDRYDHDMQNYVRAKFRILRNQTPADAFVYWKDDPVMAAQLQHTAVAAQPFAFAQAPGPGEAAYVSADGMLTVNTPHQNWTMPRADLSLNGLHNLYNSMAAALAASLLDVPAESIKRGLSDFEGVEHRLEKVTEAGGILYINDSKATNVNSTWYALESMSRPTVLILGGKDKGNDYTEILPLVRRKVTHIVAMGIDNTKIKRFFEGTVPVTSTHSLNDALRAARRTARPGDTVLLSPCCASFDLFKSYEDRGRQFKKAVLDMATKD